MGFLRDQEVPKQKRSSTFLRKAEFGLSKILGASDGEKDVIEQRYSVAASYQPSHAYPKTKFSFKKKGMSPCEDTGLPDYILLEPMNFLLSEGLDCCRKADRTESCTPFLFLLFRLLSS